MSDLAQKIATASGYDEKQIETIAKTVAKGASTEELVMFLSLASKYQLDPFAREIWFIKQGDKPLIMTSRDGYLAVAQRDEKFKGLQSCVVHENDEFTYDPCSGTVTHKINVKDLGKVIGAWARCEYEGRSPYVSFVKYSEYKKSSPVWTTYASAMITKVAEVFALKRQVGINGMVTQEEIGEVEVKSTHTPMVRDYMQTSEVKRLSPVAVEVPATQEVSALVSGIVPEPTVETPTEELRASDTGLPVEEPKKRGRKPKMKEVSVEEVLGEVMIGEVEEDLSKPISKDTQSRIFKAWAVYSTSQTITPGTDINELRQQIMMETVGKSATADLNEEEGRYLAEKFESLTK